MDLTSNLNEHYRAPETEVVQTLLDKIKTNSNEEIIITERARKFVETVRLSRASARPIDGMMEHYNLASPEGIALMTLAEAFMRIPDNYTKDALLKDKLTDIDLRNFFLDDKGWLNKAVFHATQYLLKSPKKLSQTLLRTGVTQAMRVLINKFVMAQTLKKALTKRDKHYCYSYDILGEAACTKAEAQRFFNEYLQAIPILQTNNVSKDEISVKLSALHPRYEYTKQDLLVTELTQSLKILALSAQSAKINLIIDAEMADCLEVSLHIFEKLARDPQLKEWQGLGLAVQAYQKRAPGVIDWLIWLAGQCHKRFRVRLVKGAYWDTEIKLAQEQGLKDYPVFTRKKSTDLCFLYCAQRMLAHPNEIYSAFGTHNAHTIASILEYAQGSNDYEFQRLYGMGQEIYHQLIKEPTFQVPVRVYAPVGGYRELLPYLVRRLLENGANSSFINAIHNPQISVEELVESPIQYLRQQTEIPHPKIPLPQNIYSNRQNSSGVDLSNSEEAAPILAALETNPKAIGASIINGMSKNHSPKPAFSPIDHSEIGHMSIATEGEIEEAILSAHHAHKKWVLTPIPEKAEILEKIATLLEAHRIDLITLCVYEGGRTIPDSIAEVREAVDYCRYYAQQARENLSGPVILQGPTGEENLYRLRGRGVFLCISPWNFPLAIFTGQVVAALVTGNCVLAKPSSQTAMIAGTAVNLMHQAGIPPDVLHLIQAPGKAVGAQLLPDERIAGVCFTGSTETGWQINRMLAARQSAIVPLIAETGGQNAMIVDSSALPEQVIKDVLSSAFNSAGQRCSALRLLLLQEETAGRIKEMLKGAMAELEVGDPRKLSTDIGPLIDKTSKRTLTKYMTVLKKSASLLMKTPLQHSIARKGNYLAPCAYEIHSLHLLKQEHFGPILHVMTYAVHEKDKIMNQINELGFGLTFGLHTRINSSIMTTANQIEAGNVYVNRNMIGAVVGVQPFGGQGLSGTGPKAGGPQYLYRFMHEQAISINTAAQGGNTTLMLLKE